MIIMYGKTKNKVKVIVIDNNYELRILKTKAVNNLIFLDKKVNKKFLK